MARIWTMEFLLKEHIQRSICSLGDGDIREVPKVVSDSRNVRDKCVCVFDLKGLLLGLQSEVSTTRCPTSVENCEVHKTKQIVGIKQKKKCKRMETKQNKFWLLIKQIKMQQKREYICMYVK